jgi:hypothetical protein
MRRQTKLIYPNRHILILSCRVTEGGPLKPSLGLSGVVPVLNRAKAGAPGFHTLWASRLWNPWGAPSLTFFCQGWDRNSRLHLLGACTVPWRGMIPSDPTFAKTAKVGHPPIYEKLQREFRSLYSP